MGSYLDKLEQIPPASRWETVRKWMDDDPFGLFTELREYRPVLELPELTLVTRFSDCANVLRQHDVFSVALYKPKQGDFWMSQDDTPVHWREKSIMKSILDLEQLDKIRSYVAGEAAAILQRAKGEIEAVNGLCRAVAIALVQERFGFDQSDPKELIEWSYWNQQDAFHNQAFDSVVVKDPALIVKKRKESNEQMAKYLAALVQRRAEDLQAGKDSNDTVTRLLKLSLSGSVELDITRVAQNVGGLLIGTVETTSHTAINAISTLLEKPEILAAVKQHAHAENLSLFDGYVFEALRFNPAFPYMFRQCEKPAKLACGTDYETDVSAGTTVMLATHSAMFDGSVFPEPERFEPTRNLTNTFHFGQGLHECLGIHIGKVMIPEIVRQVFLLPGIHAIGPVDHQGTAVPENYLLKWDSP